MTSPIEQILNNGPENVDVVPYAAGSVKYPFEPSLAICITDGEAESQVAHMSIASARRLAYQILDQCEAAYLKRAERLALEALRDL